MTQNFKGDPTELKMQAVAGPLLDLTDLALNQFYSEGFDSSAWLLLLYDERRMPFSERINRETFLLFIRRALENFPFIGSFESYMFILKSVFGEDSDITFTIPDPGKLGIDVDAYNEITFEFLLREIVGGVYEYSTLITDDGDDIALRGVTGIQTEYELNLLFSEIMPAGIIPAVTLSFFNKSFWIAEDGDGISSMIDDDENQFIFVELGG